MLILNMRSKDASVNVETVTEYIDTKKEQNKTFIHQLESEVKLNPRKARKLIKLMSSTGTMLSAILFTTTAPSTSAVSIDPELKEIILIAMVVVVLMGIVAAMLAIMTAGIWKMFPFFGGKQADGWSQDIIKGFTQVLGGPIIIGAIIILFSLLFGKFPMFQPVKAAVDIFLHN